MQLALFLLSLPLWMEMRNRLRFLPIDCADCTQSTHGVQKLHLRCHKWHSLGHRCCISSSALPIFSQETASTASAPENAIPPMCGPIGSGPGVSHSRGPSDRSSRPPGSTERDLHTAWPACASLRVRCLLRRWTDSARVQIRLAAYR